MTRRWAAMVALCITVGGAASSGCGPRTENAMTDTAHTDSAADAFWRDAKKVADPIGEGGKSFYPYQLRGEIWERARTLNHPLDAYQALLAQETDPTWREVLLFLVASTDDARADQVLLHALDRPELRARALYLLGAIGTKGWPSRNRDRPRILDALAKYVDDVTPYRDVYYRDSTFQVGDFAKAAFVRVAGVASFPVVATLDGDPDHLQAQFIGMALPVFSDHDRIQLSAAIHAFAR